jgi:hypothetical protein
MDGQTGAYRLLALNLHFHATNFSYNLVEALIVSNSLLCADFHVWTSPFNGQLLALFSRDLALVFQVALVSDQHPVNAVVVMVG